jgi:hypothetical protein
MKIRSSSILIGAFVLLSLDEIPRIRTWIKQARMHNEL